VRPAPRRDVLAGERFGLVVCVVRAMVFAVKVWG